MDETDIICRLRRGEESAFEKVFRKYYVKLCLYAEHYLKDKSTSEEIVEDFFVHLWDNHRNIQIESNLTGYLFKSIHNRCLKYLRHEKVKQKYLEEGSYIFTDRELLEPVSDEVPEASILKKELEKEINDALNALPDQCRRVFEYSRFEDLSYQEIADKMNISVNTVKTQMKRALLGLRDALKDFLTVILVISALFID